jgi:hypothetical protein
MASFVRLTSEASTSMLVNLDHVAWMVDMAPTRQGVTRIVMDVENAGIADEFRLYNVDVKGTLDEIEAEMRAQGRYPR